MNLSVLICTYNRSRLLNRALRSIVVNAAEKPDQIVVVNGGDDRADRVVQDIMPIAKSQAIEVKLIKTVNKNLATSRNIGLPHCTSDVIAMTDDDAEVFPDWVTLMKEVHEKHPEAGAVGGPVIGTNTESLVGEVADLMTFPSWQSAQYVRTLPGVNISYKRHIVDLIGFQDETLFRGEDVDYNWRVQHGGYKVFFDPRIKVYHYHRPTFKAFLYQHYMYGRAYFLVRRKWPDMYCVYPHQITCFRDILKLGNFVARLVYDPLNTTRKAASLRRSRFSMVPVMFVAECAWRSGMVIQACRAGQASEST